jgi:prevent-host-death family protein
MTQITVSQASRNLSHWLNRASFGREVVVVTSHGRAKAVILGVDAFEELLGLGPYADWEPTPLDEFRRAFREALAEAGYQSHEELLALVREAKREVLAARAQLPVD